LRDCEPFNFLPHFPLTSLAILFFRCFAASLPFSPFVSVFFFFFITFFHFTGQGSYFASFPLDPLSFVASACHSGFFLFYGRVCLNVFWTEDFQVRGFFFAGAEVFMQILVCPSPLFTTSLFCRPLSCYLSRPRRFLSLTTVPAILVSLLS